MSEATFEQVRPEDYLTRLAASDLGRSYKSLATDQLGIEQGQVVLDLGCGPGADLPAFAEAVGPTGLVLGLDNDPQAIEQARRLNGGPAPIDVRHADVHVTGLPDRSVDRAHTDRVLQHVEDPLAVLCEARRVLRPNSYAVFAEPDWDTLIIDSDDLEMPRRYRRFVVERVVRNSCIGRQLSGLAHYAGFLVDRIIPVTTVFRDLKTADQVLGFHRVAHRAAAAGYLGKTATTRWLANMDEQPFFASVTLFMTVAHTPTGSPSETVR